MTVVGIYLSNNFIYVFSFLRSDSIRLFFIDPRREIWGRMVIEKVVELPADLFWSMMPIMLIIIFRLHINKNKITHSLWIKESPQ